MKKLISVLAAVAVISSQAFAAEATVDTVFNEESKTVYVDAKFDSSVKLTLSIAPHYNYTASTDTPPAFIYFYDTDADGVLDVDIPIDEEMASGKYDVCIDAPGYSSSQSFIYANPTDAGTASVIASVNSATDSAAIYNLLTNPEEAAKLGIDAEADEFKNVAKEVCDYIFFIKSEDYTFETLLSAIDKAVEVNNVLLDIKSSEAYGLMREIIEKNMQLLGINTDGDYSKIENKYRVFAQMYKIRDTFNSAEDVSKAFGDAVAAIYEEETYNPPVSRPSHSSGGGGGGGGSVVMPVAPPPDTDSTSDAPVQSTQPLPQTALYSDISDHFSKESVILLSAKNIISGYPDGSFRPDANVTRAEFVKIAALVFGITEDSDVSFADVKKDAWYAGYVGSLSKLGVIGGYDGRFNPDMPITRQDAACVIFRLLSLSEIVLGNAGEDFSDSADISSYAKEAVGVLRGNGVVNGNENMFYPLAKITRGEAAVIVANTLGIMNR